jgi:argininosuccinate synthase
MLGVDAHVVDEIVHDQPQVATGVEQKGQVTTVRNLSEATLLREYVLAQLFRLHKRTAAMPHVVAQEEGAYAVAHGATGKGNDQVRFELSAAALAPEIEMIAPWRMQHFRDEFPGRAEMIEWAAKENIPVQASASKSYSMDRNLLHISFEGGILEDPWAEPPADMFVLSVSPEDAPDKPTAVEIEFERGTPVAVDGEKLSPATLLAKLNALGGANGVGRVDLVENRYVGMKSRGVYETPGGTILHAAHRAMESITMDREVMHIRDGLIPKFAELVYYGFWYSPEMDALRALIDQSQTDVSGTVRLKLYKGNVIVTGRKSDASLYDPEVVTFEEDAVYDQADAGGFIKLNALRLRTRKLLDL